MVLAKPTEAQEQGALVRWWSVACRQYGLPAFALYHIPNEGSGSAIRGRHLREQGVRSGCPDLSLDVPRGKYHGLRIEMKRKGGRVSAAQLEFLSWLEGQGYRTGVCFGWTEAKDLILDYLRG